MTRKMNDYAAILFGVGIVAIGFVTLVIPSRIAAGGASGIAAILVYLLGISPGLVLLAINVPLLDLSSVLLGLRFGVYTDACHASGVVRAVFVWASSLTAANKEHCLPCI